MSLSLRLVDEENNGRFYTSITHNLGRMANEAGIYECLWRPTETGIETANQMIEPLEKGIALLATQKSRFIEFDAPNGWGVWEDFLPLLMDLLQACRDNPEARVEASV